jgi:adenine-specific DNA-methyltransferase
MSIAMPLDLVYGPTLPGVGFADPARPWLLAQVGHYPELRYMGSKHRLLGWIHGVLSNLDFESASDPFSGSGCISYLLKAMGKRVVSSDFLNFPTVLATATIANSSTIVDEVTLGRLLEPPESADDFIARTFDGIFFSTDDRVFLDHASANIDRLGDTFKRAIARSALIRACLKKQPRGVFTVSGDLSHYDDGRRDLRISIREHFIEQIQAFNRVVFDNGHDNVARCGDVFELEPAETDLVYFDPPYVPRSDDNCYVKRYHFLEGLSCYWRGLRIMENTKVKKIEKKHSPFGSRKTAHTAFDALFRRYQKSVIVLSYSSNGYPDLNELESLLARYKSRITIHQRPHRYHFGTHSAVERASVREYLLVGQ